MIASEISVQWFNDWIWWALYDHYSPINSLHVSTLIVGTTPVVKPSDAVMQDNTKFLLSMNTTGIKTSDWVVPGHKEPQIVSYIILVHHKIGISLEPPSPNTPHATPRLAILPMILAANAQLFFKEQILLWFLIANIYYKGIEL